MTTLSKDEVVKMAIKAGLDQEFWLAESHPNYDNEMRMLTTFAALCRADLVAEVELPEPMGYLCDWGNDSYGLTHQTVYYGEPGSPIEDDWNCHPTVHKNTQLFTRDQLLAYGAAQRLAGREQAIEDCATAAWTHYMDTAKRKGIGPDVMPEWIACKAIRALAASLQEQT